MASNVDPLQEEVERLRREVRESHAQRDHFQRVCAQQQATLETLQSQMAAMQEQIAQRVTLFLLRWIRLFADGLWG